MRGLAFGAALIPAVVFGMDIQGHRGARGLLPENTLPAFSRALELGVDTLELDTGVTKDGVVVVHHDRRLNPDVARLNGKWLMAPAPTIYSLTFDELQGYDVGRIRPGSEYAQRFPGQKPVDGTRIPRLSALFSLAEPYKAMRFNIETKVSPDHPDETLQAEPFARALIAEIRKAGVERRTTIQSFDYRTLKIVEREAPEIDTVYLTEGRDSQPQKAKQAGAKIWSPDFRALSAETVKEAHRLGLRVVVWTVNEPADLQRARDWGVDGVISDYPDRAIQLLRKS